MRDSDPGEEAKDTKDAKEPREAPAADATAEGVVDLLGNGSGFLRVSPPDPSDGDVYISAAQVRRCELVDGDTVTGPVRAPRRSERYPSLVRVDTINGRPADEVAEGTPFEELPAALPTERFALGGDDPTLRRHRAPHADRQGLARRRSPGRRVRRQVRGAAPARAARCRRRRAST